MGAGRFCLSQGIMFPVGDLLTQQHIQVSGRERGNIPVHKGEVWTLWKGAVLLLQQLPNSAWSKHHSWQHLRLLIREETLECRGTAMAVGAWGDLLTMAGSMSKTPLGIWVRGSTELAAMGYWPKGGGCSPQMPSQELAHSPVPTGNQWLFPLAAGKKNQQWAHIQKRKVNCHTSCTAGEKGDWPLLLRTRVIKNICLKTWKGHLTVHSVKSCQSYKVNM